MADTITELTFKMKEELCEEKAQRPASSKSFTIKREILKWYNLECFEWFYEAIAECVIGQPELKVFLANIYNYLMCLAHDLPTNNNVLLASPSGSGKTETYRALKRYFAKHIPMLPVKIIDASQITATGYRGADPADMIQPFVMDGDKALGICFLDEFDKKLAPSFSSHGDNVNREVQENLLAMIEGGTIPDRHGEIINTENVMFIGMGSFDAFREKRECVAKTIGFGTAEENTTTGHFEPITRENMVEHGGISELIGRFPYIINYGRLTEEAVDRIIDKTVVKIEDAFDCEIYLSDVFREHLHDISSSKFGCRLIDSSIRSICLREYSDFLCDTKGERLVIDIESVQ